MGEKSCRDAPPDMAAHDRLQDMTGHERTMLVLALAARVLDMRGRGAGTSPEGAPGRRRCVASLQNT